MAELQKQFEQETGRKEPKPYIVNDDSGLFVLNLIAEYWKAYSKWLELKAQPKAKPATLPPSDDIKAVIDSNYFQDGRECFERRIVFASFDVTASVKIVGFFPLLSPRGRLISLIYNVHKGKIIDKRFEYWSDAGNEGLIKTDMYSSDPYFDIELQSVGGGNYQETVVMYVQKHRS